MSDEHERFGASCGGSRWFNAEPNVTAEPVETFIERWRCPVAGCAGEMRYAGYSWMTNPPGNHHTCTACKFTAALRGETYPREVTRPRATPGEP